ncbi:hypothetical protein [Streptomyces sp. Ag109_O5-10]|uniref:hypothetical protein n=1 Tax=Streptomyces sp. Ag109_O5-10 TaxID=1855349 RepID=UPI000898A732|nr:hypothetical protein [Streptomyces sp. Ag109_O5-10]SEF18996.1 hypothetical protein SAMN05216533_8544 [Streptomyces sp. Ag109_O5-10]
MADSMTRTITTDEANRRLGQHLLAVVREQDARIPAERRAPRTVAEMRARLAAVALDDSEQDACGLCGRWTLCGPCGGQLQRAAAVPAGTVGA